MKQQGMTLIEIMVLVVIGATVILIAMPLLFGTSGNSNVSIGINGVTESRCIEGYKFVMDQKGNARQILDEFGKGVRCQNGQF